MQQVLEALLVALLALIAFELYLIFRELSRLSIPRPRFADEERQQPAQTITVNVGSPQEQKKNTVENVPVAPESPPPALPPAETVSEEAKEEAEAARSSDLKEAEAPPRPVERGPIALGSRPTPSGLIAKKCPSCGVENSTYRAECFNCGARL